MKTTRKYRVSFDIEVSSSTELGFREAWERLVHNRAFYHHTVGGLSDNTHYSFTVNEPTRLKVESIEVDTAVLSR